MGGLVWRGGRRRGGGLVVRKRGWLGLLRGVSGGMVGRRDWEGQEAGRDEEGREGKVGMAWSIYGL